MLMRRSWRRGTDVRAMVPSQHGVVSGEEDIEEVTVRIVAMAHMSLAVVVPRRARRLTATGMEDCAYP